jgi:hypothetical protein
MIHEPTQAIEFTIPTDQQHRHERRLRYLRQRRQSATVLPRRAGVSALGLLISMLLHSVLLGSLWWGGALLTSPRDKASEGAGASAQASIAEPGPTLILINLTAPATARPAVPLTRDATQQDDSANTTDAVGNDAQRALLMGMYLGQIRARIDRAWSRPRTAIGTPGTTRFDCQVQIKQSQSGEVTEVTLRSCSGDTRWQLSLVAAIQNASPLPAPPDPSVFEGQLVLSFDAAAYQPDGSEQGFEPPITSLIVSARASL